MSSERLQVPVQNSHSSGRVQTTEQSVSGVSSTKHRQEGEGTAGQGVQQARLRRPCPARDRLTSKGTSAAACTLRDHEPRQSSEQFSVGVGSDTLGVLPSLLDAH